MDFLERVKQIVENVGYTCPLCGTALYLTDYNDQQLTFHCSSDKAKFWTFGRGSAAQIESKFHWDRSRRDIIIGKDVL